MGAAAGKQKHTHFEAYVCVCVGGAEHKNAACELASAWDAKLRALETREGTMHCKAGDFFSSQAMHIRCSEMQNCPLALFLLYINQGLVYSPRLNQRRTISPASAAIASNKSFC
jgi:hypothetical protein